MHRLDGPAIEWADGTKIWYINNQMHREDGPAVEWADGTKEWWLNSQEIFPEEWLKENNINPNNMSEEDQVALILRWI